MNLPTFKDIKSKPNALPIAIATSLLMITQQLPTMAKTPKDLSNNNVIAESYDQSNNPSLGLSVLETIKNGQSSIKSIKELPESKSETIIPGVEVRFGENDPRPKNMIENLKSSFGSKYSPLISKNTNILIFSASRYAINSTRKNSEAINFRVVDGDTIYHIIVLNHESFSRTEEQKISDLPENIRKQVANYPISKISSDLKENLSSGKKTDMFGEWGNISLTLESNGLMPSLNNEVREAALKDFMLSGLQTNGFTKEDALGIAESSVNSFVTQEHTWAQDSVINTLTVMAKILLYEEGTPLTSDNVDTKITELINADKQSITDLYLACRQFIRGNNSYNFLSNFAYKETADVVAVLIREYINKTQLNNLPFKVKTEVTQVQEGKDKGKYTIQY
jgi:hypothetical protein